MSFATRRTTARGQTCNRGGGLIAPGAERKPLPLITQRMSGADCASADAQTCPAGLSNDR
jgi:hypothetical protein